MDAMGMSEEECLQRLLSHNPQAELPPPPTKAGGIKSKSKVTFASPLEPKPQPTLDTKQRGKAVLVVPSVKYQESYDWADLCEQGARVQSGQLKISWFKNKNKEGGPLYKVPYGTMHEYCKDDRVWHEEHKLPGGKLGVPHWRAEQERGRTSLKTAGGTAGGGTLLGTGETALMLEVAKKFKAGVPYLSGEVDRGCLSGARSLVQTEN